MPYSYVCTVSMYAGICLCMVKYVMYRTIIIILSSVLVSFPVSLRTVTSIGVAAFAGKYPDLVEWWLYCTVLYCMLGDCPIWLGYGGVRVGLGGTTVYYFIVLLFLYLILL